MDKDQVIAELRAKLAQAERRLEIEKRRHALGMSRARIGDPPEVLRTLGFWPDCACMECWAIHCLDMVMG